jgi:hypothetical protein
MRLAVTSALTGVILLLVIFELLRRRQLREKYAILWLTVIAVIVPIAVYPRLLDGAARFLGVASGASLILFLGFVFLLLVCTHLSWEVSRLEEETRTLAEAIALLRAEQPVAEHDAARPAAEPVVTAPAGVTDDRPASLAGWRRADDG